MLKENKIKIIKKNNNFILENNKYEDKFLYFKYFIFKNILNNLFKKLQDFKLKILTEEELKDKNIYDNVIYYEDKKVVFKELFYDHYYLNKITDYFQKNVE